MAIPVHLQQFKASGVYRVVWDRSNIANVDTQTLRLVVGYSEKGPFNTPVYISSTADFITMFGGISKKLEKRGIYFHRMALEMLKEAPIICLNIKKFSGETVDGATISTTFNPKYNPIETVKLRIEDVYTTTRFWELEPSKLNDLTTASGGAMSQYINISHVSEKSQSVSIFIRKAAGTKVSQYNMTVNDWYSDKAEELPEFLENHKGDLVSDYFAEIYVFAGKFNVSQVLGSSTLKHYFDTYTNDEGDIALKLKKFYLNAFGEPQDTLDTLYADPTSNAVGHYVGCLIPNFKDKQGAYVSLDAAFNTDSSKHNLMMAFNDDLLENEEVSINLAGRELISTDNDIADPNAITLQKIFNPNGKPQTTKLLGNLNAPIIADKISVSSNIYKLNDEGKLELVYTYSLNNKNLKNVAVSGSFYVKAYDTDNGMVTLSYLGDDVDDFTIEFDPTETSYHKGNYYINLLRKLGVYVKVTKDDNNNVYTLDEDLSTTYYDGPDKPFELTEEGYVDFKTSYISQVITSVRRIEANYVESTEVVKEATPETYDFMSSDIDPDSDVQVDDEQTNTPTNAQYGRGRIEILSKDENSARVKVISTESSTEGVWVGREFIVHSLNTGTPIRLHEENDNDLSIWVVLSNHIEATEEVTETKIVPADNSYNDADNIASVTLFDVHNIANAEYIDNNADYVKYNIYGPSLSFIYHANSGWKKENAIINGVEQEVYVSEDDSLLSVLKVGDYVLAEDGTIDANNDGIANDTNNYFDVVQVQEIGKYTADNVTKNYIKFTGTPHEFVVNSGSSVEYFVKYNGGLNQEIGNMEPVYFEGYDFINDKPSGTSMYAKVQWQNEILSVLTDYKGLRTGLLNKAEIDYRYVIDTFESYPVNDLKAVLSMLCKEKQSAFCISNFPSVQTFVKCPYTSFTDDKGNFDVKYVVEGYNKSKSAAMKFSLPSEYDGASFIAFYTPLKFSDGYIDTIVPSAAHVSNLFIGKYMSRHPYDIVAGPNYGSITASGLVGPDYRYSKEELNIIEPFGVNCMVYRTSFGTFINANQTAKQTPVSALSKVHVRELVIFLQDEIEKVLQAYQWEFNNQRTRNAILDKANSICELAMSNGGLQAYKNVMDASNNTPEIIDNEMAVISTHIEPGMGCGKMVQELTLYRTGQMSVSLQD